MNYRRYNSTSIRIMNQVQESNNMNEQENYTNHFIDELKSSIRSGKLDKALVQTEFLHNYAEQNGLDCENPVSLDDIQLVIRNEYMELGELYYYSPSMFTSIQEYTVQELHDYFEHDFLSDPYYLALVEYSKKTDSPDLSQDLYDIVTKLWESIPKEQVLNTSFDKFFYFWKEFGRPKTFDNSMIIFLIADNDFDMK